MFTSKINITLYSVRDKDCKINRMTFVETLTINYNVVLFI